MSAFNARHLKADPIGWRAVPIKSLLAHPNANIEIVVRASVFLMPHDPQQDKAHCDHKRQRTCNNGLLGPVTHATLTCAGSMRSAVANDDAKVRSGFHRSAAITKPEPRPSPRSTQPKGWNFGREPELKQL